MCNLSQGVYDSGYNCGYDSGFEKGTDTTTVHHIALLVRNKGMDIEECLVLLRVPETKRDEYRKSVMTELGLTIC